MHNATTSTTDVLLSAVTGSTQEVVELGHPHFTGMPCSPNHPGFRMTLIRRHGDMVRPDGGSASNEIIVTGGHVGTHVDALSHVSHEGMLHGGVDAADAQRGGKFSQLGADQIPFLLRRGLLLDIAALHGVEALEAGQAITAKDLQDAADAAGVSPRSGDVVLIRTGWARHFEDPAGISARRTASRVPMWKRPAGSLRPGSSPRARTPPPSNTSPPARATACCRSTGSCWWRTASTSSST